MKKNEIATSILFLIFCISATISFAQSLHPFRVDTVKEKSEVRVSLWFTNDYLFMGRGDSVKAPYLSPYIGYYHKSGLFINGSLSYLTSDGRVDLIKLKGGYDYFGKKTEAGITLTEYFFSDYSYTVQSEMSTALSGYVGYDLSAFMIYADAAVGISESADVFLGGEISRKIYALHDRLRIIPAIYINAGTQMYYDEYYSKRSTQTGSGKGKGAGSQSVSSNNLMVSESSEFQLLDYEADLQISYKIDNVRLYIASTWTFPVNPATVSTDQGIYEEELKNGFYWSTGVRVTFK